MSKSLAVKVIAELNSEIKSILPEYKGIYLFGSYATGKAKADSDYDLAIILNNHVNSSVKDSIRKIIYKKMLEHDIIIDNPIINYADLLKPNSYLKQRILEEGVFYGAWE